HKQFVKVHLRRHQRELNVSEYLQRLHNQGHDRQLISLSHPLGEYGQEFQPRYEEFLLLIRMDLDHLNQENLLTSYMKLTSIIFPPYGIVLRNVRHWCRSHEYQRYRISK